MFKNKNNKLSREHRFKTGSKGFNIVKKGIAHSLVNRNINIASKKESLNQKRKLGMTLLSIDILNARFKNLLKRLSTHKNNRQKMINYYCTC